MLVAGNLRCPNEGENRTRHFQNAFLRMPAFQVYRALGERSNGDRPCRYTVHFNCFQQDMDRINHGLEFYKPQNANVTELVRSDDPTYRHREMGYRTVFELNNCEHVIQVYVPQPNRHLYNHGSSGADHGGGSSSTGGHRGVDAGQPVNYFQFRNLNINSEKIETKEELE